MIYYVHKQKGEIKMRYFVFVDNATDEEFIITADTKKEAWGDAKMYFADPSFLYECTEEEAERAGIDIY